MEPSESALGCVHASRLQVSRPLPVQRALCGHHGRELPDNGRWLGTRRGAALVAASGDHVRCVVPTAVWVTPEHVRQYGTVRLRMSLTFYDTRARLVSYFKPPPQFCVPFVNRAVRADCAFAHQGRFPPELYNFVVLESHIEEIKAAARSVAAVSGAFIYYRAPSSLSSFVS